MSISTGLNNSSLGVISHQEMITQGYLMNPSQSLMVVAPNISEPIQSLLIPSVPSLFSSPMKISQTTMPGHHGIMPTLGSKKETTFAYKIKTIMGTSNHYRHSALTCTQKLWIWHSLTPKLTSSITRHLPTLMDIDRSPSQSVSRISSKLSPLIIS